MAWLACQPGDPEGDDDRDRSAGGPSGLARIVSPMTPRYGSPRFVRSRSRDMKTLVRSALLVAATALMVLTSSTAGAQSGYEPVPPAPLPGPGTIVNTTGILSGEPGSAW